MEQNIFESLTAATVGPDSLITASAVLTVLVGALTLGVAVATLRANVRVAEMSAEAIADFRAVLCENRIYLTCQNVPATLHHVSILEQGSTDVTREESLQSPKLAGEFPVRMAAGDTIELNVPKRFQGEFSIENPAPLGLVFSHSRAQKKKPLCRVVSIAQNVKVA